MPDLPKIEEYHAHIYFNDAASRRTAMVLRGHLEKAFGARASTLRDEPAGPHPKPMALSVFATEDFDRVVPYLMFNRAGLDILIHAETDDPLAAHRDHALWLGAPVDLDFDYIRDFADRQKREEAAMDEAVADEAN